nr:GAF domain-containing protein [uncultured Cohaesibacter sp.]
MSSENKPSMPQTMGITVAVPPMSFDLAKDICRKAFGFRLFTILLNDSKSGEIMRLYSSNEADYPPGGRKPMGPTPWGDIVLKRGICWLGDGEEEIRWAFPDADRILSLGCHSCACAPIIHEQQVVGVLSLSDDKGHYSADDLAGIAAIARLLAPLVLLAD